VNNGSNFFKKSIVGILVFGLLGSVLSGHLLGGKARAQSIAGHLLGDNVKGQPGRHKGNGPADGDDRRGKIAPDLQSRMEVAGQKSSSEDRKSVV